MSEASRRRWLTLAELVALAGVVIAALTLWNSWQDRKDARAEREAEHRASMASSEATQHHVGLVAAGKGGEVLPIRASDCTLQSFDATFPTALGLAPQRTVVDGRLRAAWVEHPLLTLATPANVTRGRLPVLLESRCEAAEGERNETAVYVLVWRSHGRLLRGHELGFFGIAERDPARDAAAGQARIDKLWTADKPA